jgi:hypothetical protein
MTIITEEVWTKRDFVDLARRQQQFVLVFLLIFAVNVAAALVSTAMQPLARGTSILLSLVSLYFVYKLVVAVLPASATWVITAYFVLSAVLPPIAVGVMVLALLGYLNGLAIKRLRLTGVRVGLLGARISDLEALQEDFTATQTV